MRDIPKSIQEETSRIWDCASYVRRITTPRARMFWCVRMVIPDRHEKKGLVLELDRWWLERHFQISDRQRKARRRRGEGNAFLVRCGQEALLFTNGTKVFAQGLLEAVHREVFGGRALEKLELRHIDDGIEFHDLLLQRRPLQLVHTGHVNDRPAVPNKPARPAPRELADKRGQRKYASKAGSWRRPISPPKGDGASASTRPKMRLYVRPAPATVDAFKAALEDATRRGDYRFPKKPEAVIAQYNAAVATFWSRHRYADWEFGEPAQLDHWALARLYRKVASSMYRRYARRVKRAKTMGQPVAAIPKPKIHSWVGFRASLRARVVRIRHRKAWRMGQTIAPIPLPKPSGKSASTKPRQIESASPAAAPMSA